MKRRILMKSTYIGLSVGMASLLIFTALPYYLQTSIAFPGWNIYWSYADVQKKMMFLFPGLSFVLALTTLKKRNTWEDVFLNIAAPLTILLMMRCFQYHPKVVLLVLVVIVNISLSEMIDIWFDDKYEGTLKKARICYYRGRRIMGILLLIVMTPITVWTAHNEYYDDEIYLRLFSNDMFSDSEEETGENIWTVIDEDQWENLAVNSRFEEFSKMVSYFLKDQRSEPIKLYACKELTDGTLAYYTDESKSISVNVIYLNSCSYREAVHVAAHECRHCIQHQGIKAIEVLEDAGIDCKNLDYFAEVYALKEANDNYYLDSLHFDTYTDNLLEQDSEEYANEQEKNLIEQGYLREE